MKPARDHEHAAASVAALAARCASIPGEMRRYLDGVAAQPLYALGNVVVATGIGASEAPARMLVRAWQEAGRRAWFVPLSHFASHPQLPSDAQLVVFSQSLSPNARLAFRDPALTRRTLLVTSLAADDAGEAGDFLRLLLDAGVRVLTIPPQSETGSLVRVVGPALSMLAALELAARRSGAEERRAALARVPDAVERAYAAGFALAERLPAERLLDSKIAIITVDESGERAHGLRWKLLEALGHCDPAVWDILQVAHGPLQHFFERSLVLLVLANRDHVLVPRLASLCRPERHALLSVPSTLGELAVFEWDAIGNALCVAALERRPRDLSVWPAQGLDGPLYDLGK